MKLELLPDLQLGTWSCFDPIAKTLNNDMERAFGKTSPDFVVYVSQCFSGPISIHKPTSSGIYLRPGNPAYYSPQMLFQLSHEICHLLVGPVFFAEYKWLEESVCALASITFPIALSSGVDGHLKSYILQESLQIEPFPVSELLNPFSPLADYFRTNPYDRPKIMCVANQLTPIASKWGYDVWRFFSNLSSVPAGYSLSEVLDFLCHHISISPSTHNTASWEELKSDILFAFSSVMF